MRLTPPQENKNDQQFHGRQVYETSQLSFHRVFRQASFDRRTGLFVIAC
jgi:hypothetical protein